MEVSNTYTTAGNQTSRTRKRSLSEVHDSDVVHRATQRQKLDITTSKEFSARLQPELANSSVVSDVFQHACFPKKPIVIAHSDIHQRFFEKHRLSWGVQWEIGRLISSEKLRYEEIQVTILKNLTGPSAVAAPLVEKLLGPQKGKAQYCQTYEEAFARELSVKTPWAELDKEEVELTQDPLSGLGCNSVHDDWYGGKIAFVARLREREKKSNDNPRYFLELDSPELGTSTRFTRRWGSRRFLRVRIPDTILYQSNNQLLGYFKNNFVLHGKVFRPFYAKEHSVFLFDIDSIYTQGRMVPNPHSKITFDQFIQWHNPMRLNKHQSLAKWCARMALGLSNSVPGVIITPENIHEIDDIYAIRMGLKPESKHIFTDGCGFTNLSTMVYLKYKYNWDLVPSAIQYRQKGAKGLYLLYPEDNGAPEAPFEVWIRPSQRKIVYDQSSPLDQAHTIMDVLRKSHLKHPARLSTEIIVNLAQNGVSYDVFEGLLKDGLQNIAASLTQWSGQYAMQNLWAAVAGANGSVIRSRMSREARGSSRVLGFSSRDDDDKDGEDEDATTETFPVRSKAWWVDEISGCPSTLEETVMVLLAAGFEPQSCAILAMKLKEVFKKALNSYIEKYKITVPRSCEAWIVPDPCGVLEAGEIFLKSSDNLIGQDGLSRDHLLGDVLVTRHPCRVPSDIQKVRAVWKDELRRYCDVIVFSVKGERSLASMLGGGDYDGDTVHVIWEPTIVTAFRRPDDKFADPPPNLDNAFEKDTLTVEEFLKNHEEKHEALAMSDSLQDYLLAALKDVSLVGQYSNWHDVAVYKYGYEHEEAWRLAYMFCAVLDSSKTGKTVRPDVVKRDRQSYHGRGPAWKESLLDESSSRPPPQHEAPRRQGVMSRIKFIMDYLKDAARVEYHHHMVEFEKLLNTSRKQYKDHRKIMAAGLYVDPALEAPWLQAMERAQQLIDKDGQGRMKYELEILKTHVQSIRERHREFGHHPVSLRKDNTSFTNKPIEQRQNILRELSLLFNQNPEGVKFITLSPQEVKRCRASYEHQEKRFTDGSRYSRFPFDVAMRELGNIKAESLGSCHMVTAPFYSVFNVVAAIKAFRQADAPGYTYSI
ncbi:hypothetical protein K439DRAFT_1353522 [Ramaria rubella]|nr:hypothetical protein K439DRAFT_1353522 [Ramaria rubella]